MTVRAYEKCSCGAQVELSSSTSAFLDLALSKWRREHRHEPVSAEELENLRAELRTVSAELASATSRALDYKEELERLRENPMSGISAVEDPDFVMPSHLIDDE